MKNKYLIFIFLLVSIFLSSKEGSIKFYGEYQSIFDMYHNTDYYGKEYKAFGWGLNNFANLRMKTDINEYLTFDLSLNINILAGSSTDNYRLYSARFSKSITDVNTLTLKNNNLFSIPFYNKSTYIGSFDLDRLYFKAGYKFFDIETGIIRMARGYGYFFKPVDFFNPSNPINPYSRPEGKLSFIAAFYPMDMWSIECFAVLPDNPVTSEMWGSKFGALTRFNIDKTNFEFSYNLFMPETEYLKNPEEINMPAYSNNDYSHLFTFSMKADIEIGLFFDILYRIDQKAIKEKSFYGKEYFLYRGLDASIGIDYTVNISNTKSSIYFLLEYMFNGSGMLDANEKDIGELYSDEWTDKNPIEKSFYFSQDKKPSNYLRHNYLYALIKYKVNSYLSIVPSYLFGIDDQSGLLSLNFEIEPFQAFTLNFIASYPFGWELIDSSWYRGEFGPTNIGYYQNYKTMVKIKF